MDRDKRRAMPFKKAVEDWEPEETQKWNRKRGLSLGSLVLSEESYSSSTPSPATNIPENSLSICLQNEIARQDQSKFPTDSIQKETSRIEKPWGYYSTIDLGPSYKIKKMVVYPGNRLSLQMHYHRNEYWLTIKGKALVTIGDHTFYLYPNQSTYIPVQTKHRLENPGDTLLEIIEVQNGECISEEDIIRFEDDYERS